MFPIWFLSGYIVKPGAKDGPRCMSNGDASFN